MEPDETADSRRVEERDAIKVQEERSVHVLELAELWSRCHVELPAEGEPARSAFVDRESPFQPMRATDFATDPRHRRLP